MSNDNAYPHEQPLPENVVPLNIITLNEVDPTTILRMAHDAKLTEVVIVGMCEDGSEFFASSDPDAATGIYHLMRGVHKLNRIIDRTASGDGNVD